MPARATSSRKTANDSDYRALAAQSWRKNGLVERSRAGTRVLVRLTQKGQRILGRAVEKRLRELQVGGPVLVNTLQQLINTNHTFTRRPK